MVLGRTSALRVGDPKAVRQETTQFDPFSRAAANPSCGRSASEPLRTLALCRYVASGWVVYRSASERSGNDGNQSEQSRLSTDTQREDIRGHLLGHDNPRCSVDAKLGGRAALFRLPSISDVHTAGCLFRDLLSGLVSRQKISTSNGLRLSVNLGSASHPLSDARTKRKSL